MNREDWPIDKEQEFEQKHRMIEISEYKQLKQRITELEQECKDYQQAIDDETTAWQKQISEQDKLLDECQQYLERFPDYPVFVRLLTKLRERGRYVVLNDLKKRGVRSD